MTAAQCSPYIFPGRAVVLFSMDEEKAAAYYDEMLRKGGGAARLKQGLGYGTQSPDSATATAATTGSPRPSFSTFVKGGSHADSLARFDKETRLAAVRDKLKKRPGAHDDDDDALDHDGDLVKRRPSPRSGDRDYTSRRDRNCRHGHQNHGSHSGSSSSRECRPSSRGSSGRSHDSGRMGTSRRSGSRRRHRSRSPSDSSRKSRSLSRSRSWERSISSADKRARRKRESTKREHRTNRPSRRSSRRSRSPSPRSYSSDDHYHSRRESNMGSHRSLHRKHRSRSPYMVRKGKPESSKDVMLSAKKPKAYDYSKLIPGFDNMTPGEKVKEKMKLQLSETVSKDTEKGMSSEWERFDFNKNAPLDDDAKLDYFGDGTGGHDDTGFLQNTGSTFLSSCSQARREAQIQEAHDAAIFGPSTGMSRKQMGSHKKHYSSFSMKESATVGTDTMAHVEEPPPTNNLLSDQVLTLQQGSWRERALKLKQQRAASTTI